MGYSNLFESLRRSCSRPGKRIHGAAAPGKSHWTRVCRCRGRAHIRRGANGRDHRAQTSNDMVANKSPLLASSEKTSAKHQEDVAASERPELAFGVAPERKRPLPGLASGRKNDGTVRPPGEPLVQKLLTRHGGRVRPHFLLHLPVDCFPVPKALPSSAPTSGSLQNKLSLLLLFSLRPPAMALLISRHPPACGIWTTSWSL